MINELFNPFTPSEIASGPEDFFGRSQEIATLERSLRQGSVAIQGNIGIGKSSLLARARLLMEGFNSEHHGRSVIAVGDKDIRTIDEAASLILHAFVHIDERQRRVKFKLGSLFETESAEICKYFVDGHHLSVLKRIVEEDYLQRVLEQDELLILAVDEADKCPVPLARLIRSIVTHTQQQGVKRVRFIVSGVSPFYQQMVDEDPGISRFVYKTLTLPPMPPEEAFDLVETKLLLVAKHAEENNIALTISPEIIDRMVDLSGGHPHIIQLLGSHIVEHECEDPDGVLDSRDLLNSLRRICYEDRAKVYDSTINMLELHSMLEPFQNLLERMPRGFPSRIDRKLALETIGKDSIQWLLDRNIVSAQTSRDSTDYGLVDEFLRIRFILGEADSPQEELDLETLILEEQELISEDEELED